MLFNSVDFAIFLPIVFILYWLVTNKNLKLQNLLIVSSSYLFYGWWNWKFLSLIFFSTVVDYLISRGLSTQKEKNKRKILLWLSIIVNLGLLGFFKYYNFFLDNFVSAFSFFGQPINPQSLNIILPVGISFYTFQTLSYSIDVYKRNLQPTNDFIAFSAFVSFFPQLVAGPIERATHLLPQILQKRTFSFTQFRDGIRLIIYGFFLKVFIADSLAPVVNDIFENYTSFSGGTLLSGAIFFSLQIYGDFSGYSKIARGLSKIFGFELMENFDFPYFSRNIGEFWRKWHISLNTWFRDYLYIPLGGSRKGKFRSIINVFIIFLVSGFWHGANWTFIAWGAIHAILFIPSLVLGSNRKHLKPLDIKGLEFSHLISIFEIIRTFLIVTIAWIFFRANTITDAFAYIKSINLHFDSYSNMYSIVIICFVVDILIIKYKNNNLIYFVLLGAVLAASIVSQKSEFIYFQF